MFIELTIPKGKTVYNDQGKAIGAVLESTRKITLSSASIVRLQKRDLGNWVKDIPEVTEVYYREGGSTERIFALEPKEDLDAMLQTARIGGGFGEAKRYWWQDM